MSVSLKSILSLSLSVKLVTMQSNDLFRVQYKPTVAINHKRDLSESIFYEKSVIYTHIQYSQRF